MIPCSHQNVAEGDPQDMASTPRIVDLLVTGAARHCYNLTVARWRLECLGPIEQGEVMWAAQPGSRTTFKRLISVAGQRRN